jgi:hypothetical protein
METVTDIRGLDFNVTETDCDLVAHTARMDVLVSRAGSRNKTAIMEFDPIYQAPLPEFSVSDDGGITIAVEKMNTMFKQQAEWNGIPLHYKIGHIYYPSPPPPVPAPQQTKP